VMTPNPGYTQDPRETINYIAAHDGLTLFDNNAFKLPTTTSIADRVRAQTLGSAVVLLSQGIPFIHAGQEILRSKSLDSNSYDSGDWFNLLDYSYQTNNFGVGLPPGYDSALMSPILQTAAIMQNNASILSARDMFDDFLSIRTSSTLFRLRTGQDIRDRVAFYNTGTAQVAGVVVEGINGTSPAYGGANYQSVVIVVNGNVTPQTVTIDALKNKSLVLHPVQASGSDVVVKTSTYNNATGAFAVPALTVAVFIQP
jgi:pullulanase